MEGLYGHEKEIHTGGAEAPQSKPLHAAGHPGPHFLHSGLQGSILGSQPSGYTGTAAFRKLGYNTEVLGFERIHNTTKRIRRAAKSPEGLHEGTRGGVRLTGGTGPAAPADEAARRGRQTHEAGDPGAPAADGFLKKVMKLHDGPEK